MSVRVTQHWGEDNTFANIPAMNGGAALDCINVPRKGYSGREKSNVSKYSIL